MKVIFFAVLDNEFDTMVAVVPFTTRYRYARLVSFLDFPV